ncbi:MAG: phosphoribosylaminoimidazolesuccinocarboxamide synthase [Planctomycetes bacterium]|nr:phosphoribosylaminoimidazolesuccinocarboxamide synthase [Planctomycetota bacterium]
MANALLQTHLPFPKRQGKVRDVYDLGDRLLIVSTDRISAFDWVMPNGIPDKGRILNQLSLFWFRTLGVEHHILDDALPPSLAALDPAGELQGRSVIARKAQVVPFECVIRGYLEGSGWRDYKKTGCVCGIPLPTGLRQCDRLEHPIFTPATKAETGHDENVSFEMMQSALGTDVAMELKERSVAIYQRGNEITRPRGIVIADTKLEWGWFEGRLILIDEVLTPDSSRFWPADRWQPGRAQPSFDKQFLREFLDQTGWDKNSPPPELPETIVSQTRERYLAAYEQITGSTLPK